MSVLHTYKAVNEAKKNEIEALKVTTYEIGNHIFVHQM